jgi:hypothetical protein
MTRSALLILSEYGPPDGVFNAMIKQGRIATVYDSDLDDTALDRAMAVITTMHLDQIGFRRHADALHRLLARGGRIFFNGHLVVPFLPGLQPFVPLPSQRRHDYDLVRLADHPIFAGIEMRNLVTRKSVAGFYGRGHAPLPEGAVAITGLGPDRVPVDWEWRPLEGGAVFVHSGNELWSMGGDEEGALNVGLGERIIDWALAKSSKGTMS